MATAKKKAAGKKSAAKKAAKKKAPAAVLRRRRQGKGWRRARGRATRPRLKPVVGAAPRPAARAGGKRRPWK